MRRGVWAGSSVWRVRGAGWRGGTLMNRLESMAVAPLWWSVGLRSGCLASVGPASFGFQSGFSRSFVVRRSYEGSWLRSQKSWRCVGHAPVGRRVRRAGRQRWSPTSTSSFWPSVLALRSARSSFFASAAQVANVGRQRAQARSGPAFWPCARCALLVSRVHRAGCQCWSPASTSSFWPSVLALRSARFLGPCRPPRRSPILVANEQSLVLAQRFGPAFGARFSSLASAVQVTSVGRQRALARFGPAFWSCARTALLVSRVGRAGHQRWSSTSSILFWPSVLFLRPALGLQRG